MGVMNDSTVSGVLPDPQGFVVHYPAYPSSISRAIHTLGGIPSILKARSSPSNKLEFHFRPEDPYSHPALGELRPCNNFILKISKTKPNNVPHSNNEIQPNETVTDQVQDATLSAHIVAHIPEAYHFDGMVDYQHVIPVHADVARRKKRNWSELEEPLFDKGGLMDLDHEDVMIIVPPLFAPKDVPENLVLRLPSNLSSKKRQEGVVEHHVEMDMEPVLAIDFDIKEIPKVVNWEEYIPKGSDQWESQMAVSRMFDERPIWSKVSLTERLLDMGIRFSYSMLRRLLSRISYYFSSGPFLRFWIKKGYDPRKDSNSRIYQRIDYRVPVPLRSYCDANSANKSKPRWEDICAFRAFPCKFQTSLQFFDLVDDYIQSEINKPPSQATCTYATGWFSQHVIDCIRQRLMVKFLSVFPKPGAGNLLRAATARFEKLKRECSRNPIKLNQEECQPANLDFQENNEPGNVEDDEEEAAEGNNSDEEWDAYEEPDMAGDSEIPLPSQSYLNMDNISRSHLQELFDSFPSFEADSEVQEHGSDEEYHIYEEDSDDDNSDE
ncbi:PREDICTED: general transcription factor 3C polypeptide 5-like [Lupinus angustifolius]|uniref:general transcription factor 3C polypeptide 5-like n=1 Tax=Lupinus angustifolius TaxID=3871 RepID=UPI00092F1565|nr:PREDICTED: general transcription factor 3C polypeptide 5-like [Lupinus angustifolius]